MITILWLCFIETLQATVQPTMSQFHRLLGILKVCCPRSTLIKCHHNIRSDSPFNVHYPFWCKQMLGTINMRTELYTFFTHLADTRQGEYLKSTTVGQHRTIKAIEFMQPASLFNHIQSWSQIQMISISQNNLRLNIILYFMQMNPFHCTQCTNRHEDRSLNLTMIGGYQSSTCITLRVSILQFKCHTSTILLDYLLFLFISVQKSMAPFTFSSVKAKSNTSLISFT